MIDFESLSKKPFLIGPDAYQELRHLDLTKKPVIAKHQVATPMGLLFDQVKTDVHYLGYGGYLEKRWIYKETRNFEGSEDRDIHLGIDLWIQDQTVIHAPLAGVIHSFANNRCEGDYGYCIVLQHELKEITFHTLYGHLNSSGFDQIKVGKKVKAGEPFCQVGHFEVNGNWPPHLHFQIIRDMGDYYGDYPGVCSQSDLDFYHQNCPDPSALLGFGEAFSS